MNQNVNIILKGLHTSVDENEDNIELIIPGMYYFRNGKHFVCYEETDEETGNVTKSVLKFTENYVDLIRRGANSSHLTFEKGKTHHSYYNTPMGDLFIGVCTNDIIFNSSDEASFNIEIFYSLEMNNQKVSDCNVQILIYSN